MLYVDSWCEHLKEAGAYHKSENRAIIQVNFPDCYILIKDWLRPRLPVQIFEISVMIVFYS
jgi:hypothetical protein